MSEFPLGRSKTADPVVSYKRINENFPGAMEIKETNIDMVFLIDNSSSMKDIMGEVIKACKSCVTGVQGKGTFCAYTFTHEKPELQVNSTEVTIGNVVDVQDQIAKLANCDGGTALYDAIWSVYMQIAKYRTKRGVPMSTTTCFLIFTDGQDMHSEQIKSFKDLFEYFRIFHCKDFPVRIGLVDWSADPQNLDGMNSKPDYFRHFKKGGSGSIADFIDKCFDYLITGNPSSFKNLAQSVERALPNMNVHTESHKFDPRSRTALSHVLCSKSESHDYSECKFNHSKILCKYGPECNREECYFAHFKTKEDKHKFTMAPRSVKKKAT